MCSAAPWKRRVDVLADEGALFRQGLQRTVHQDMRVRKLAAALGREGEERARAALDVDPAVLARRSGQIVELVQLFLARHDRLPERLQHPGALVKRQLPQRRPANFPRVLEHAAEIEPAGSSRRDGCAVDSARKFGETAFAGSPAVEGIVQELRGLHQVTSGRGHCDQA